MILEKSKRPCNRTEASSQCFLQRSRERRPAVRTNETKKNETSKPHLFIVNYGFDALTRRDILEDVQSVLLCLIPGHLPTWGERRK